MEDQEAEQRTLQRDLDWLARDGIEKTRDLEEPQAKEQRLRAELEAAQQRASQGRAQHQRIIEELNQSVLSLQNKASLAQQSKEQLERTLKREKELQREALDPAEREREQLRLPWLRRPEKKRMRRQN